MSQGVKRLNPFEKWMVAQNVDHANELGVGTVVGNLLNNGYPTVAAAVVEEIYGEVPA